MNFIRSLPRILIDELVMTRPTSIYNFFKNNMRFLFFYNLSLVIEIPLENNTLEISSTYGPFASWPQCV